MAEPRTSSCLPITARYDVPTFRYETLSLNTSLTNAFHDPVATTARAMAASGTANPATATPMSRSTGRTPTRDGERFTAIATTTAASASAPMFGLAVNDAPHASPAPASAQVRP